MWHPRQNLFFSSRGLRCAAWFYPASGATPCALVILGHGLGATRELGLELIPSAWQSGVRLLAAVSQVPFSNGLASTLTIPVFTALLITLNAMLDLVRQLFGLSPRYIGLVGRPGEVAMMTASDCMDGYMRLLPLELQASGAWRNRMCARAGLVVPMYMPGRRARGSQELPERPLRLLQWHRLRADCGRRAGVSDTPPVASACGRPRTHPRKDT
jgi:hypothetical protein